MGEFDGKGLKNLELYFELMRISAERGAERGVSAERGAGLEYGREDWSASCRVEEQKTQAEARDGFTGR